MTAPKPIKKNARLSQQQFFQLCNWMQQHPDVKTSSNDTIISLSKLDLSEMKVVDHHVERARKTLGGDWVRKAPKAATGAKRGRKPGQDAKLDLLLRAVTGLYIGLGVELPEELSWATLDMTKLDIPQLAETM